MSSANSPSPGSSPRLRQTATSSSWAGCGDNWWYSPWGEGFVSEYARTNPYEDFAESFVAFVMGNEYRGYDADGNLTAGLSATPGKQAYMASFIASI